jgi:dolichyl-phosphate-mannose-protein mannosyltransferase
VKRPSLSGTVFATGALLRLILALANTEANDDHLSVIRIIAHQHRFVRLREAWEGFQPQLYHGTVAVLWDLSPWQSAAAQIRIAQLVACAAGIATLWVVRRALRRQGLSPAVQLLAFALVALNPTLIGLDAQATNDAFVILFTTVALSEGFEFFETGTPRAFVVMSGAVALAVLSKGNALVVFIAVSAVLLHAIVRPPPLGGRSRRRLAAFGAAFLFVVLASAVTLGSYRRNWQDTGNPFAINGDRAPFPHWIERTYVYRPGTTSIVDTYFTFRFVDLLRHPTITNDIAVYPRHRTSLWSQLYGRAHFAHFSQHPPSWRNTSLLVLTLGRLIFVAALLPTALLLRGLARAMLDLTLPERRRALAPGARLALELRVLSVVGYIGFIILYTLTYRDFSTMKAEFLFPALLPGALLLGEEIERTRWRTTVAWALGLLLTLYLTDTLVLVAQLA